eukprot:458760_1
MAASPPTVPFGILIPSRPVITEFIVVGQQAMVEIPNPRDVSDLSFFLLPQSPVPANCGAVLYYSAPPYGTWEILGAVSQDVPSATLRTGWPIHEGMQNVGISRLMVGIEPLDTIHNLAAGGVIRGGGEDRRLFAVAVARNLFKFIASFSGSLSHGNEIVVPANILDTWIARFESKYQRDPNFMFQEQG